MKSKDSDLNEVKNNNMDLDKKYSDLIIKFDELKQKNLKNPFKAKIDEQKKVIHNLEKRILALNTKVHYISEECVIC